MSSADLETGQRGFVAEVCLSGDSEPPDPLTKGLTCLPLIFRPSGQSQMGHDHAPLIFRFFKQPKGFLVRVEGGSELFKPTETSAQSPMGERLTAFVPQPTVEGRGPAIERQAPPGVAERPVDVGLAAQAVGFPERIPLFFQQSMGRAIMGEGRPIKT